MTDKEKLLSILDLCPDNFEDIVLSYMHRFGNEFSAIRVRSLISRLDRDVLMLKILELEKTVQIANERAVWLNEYLSGRMYTTEEAAKECVDTQINHTKTIMKECGKIPTGMRW